MTMQVFYDTLHRGNRMSARGLLAIVSAGLHKVLAVRSEMDWGDWPNSPSAN